MIGCYPWLEGYYRWWNIVFSFRAYLRCSRRVEHEIYKFEHSKSKFMCWVSGALAGIQSNSLNQNARHLPERGSSDMFQSPFSNLFNHSWHVPTFTASSYTSEIFFLASVAVHLFQNSCNKQRRRCSFIKFLSSMGLITELMAPPVKAFFSKFVSPTSSSLLWYLRILWAVILAKTPIQSKEKALSHHIQRTPILNKPTCCCWTKLESLVMISSESSWSPLHK